MNYYWILYIVLIAFITLYHNITSKIMRHDYYSNCKSILFFPSYFIFIWKKKIIMEMHFYLIWWLHNRLCKSLHKNVHYTTLKSISYFNIPSINFAKLLFSSLKHNWNWVNRNKKKEYLIEFNSTIHSTYTTVLI